MIAYMGNYGKKQDENCFGMNTARFFTRHCKAETGVGWKRDSNSHGQIRTKTRRKKKNIYKVSCMKMPQH